MSLNHIYSNTSNTTQDITAWVRLYQWNAETHAKEGSVGTWQMVVDDPDGIWDFNGHRRIYSYESLASNGNQVVANGFIQRQVVSRGPYRNGVGRIWTLTLADQNTLLHRRLMNGSDANRPAETDVRRMEALIGRGGFTQMTELNTVDDSLYFSGVDPVDMDAADYRTQSVGTGYIDDCAQASGKNYFVWYRETTGDFSLWYDFASSSNWSTTARLSNVLSDVNDSTTFAVDLEHEAELDRDPSRVASGVMLPFDGVASGSNTVNGTVYVQDAGTLAEFAAIDWLAPSINVKTKAKALARAERYLEDASTEDDVIRCSVKLPAANVNDFLAGQRMDARFSHLPGYEDFSSFRILSRRVTEISEDPTRAYRLDLELSPAISETLVTASGALFYAVTGGFTHEALQIVFEQTGTIPPTCGPVPLIGPIAYGPIITNDDNKTGYDGWVINGRGEIDIHMYGDVFGVAGTSVHTLRFYMNDALVFNYVFDDITNPSRAFNFTTTLDCPLATGNHLIVKYHSSTGPTSGIPAGTGGCGEALFITAARLVVP